MERLEIMKQGEITHARYLIQSMTELLECFVGDELKPSGNYIRLFTVGTPEKIYNGLLCYGRMLPSAPEPTHHLYHETLKFNELAEMVKEKLTRLRNGIPRQGSHTDSSDPHREERADC